MQEELVILPHFKPEEVEALRKEHERRKEVFATRGMSDNDEERVRDGAQREIFWNQQIASLVQGGHDPESDSMLHARNELSHALYAQGKIDEAFMIATDPEKKAQYEFTLDAIHKDDGKTCDCPREQIAKFREGDHEIELKTATLQTVGKFPSAKHGGAMVSIQRCILCGDTNITNQ